MSLARLVSSSFRSSFYASYASDARAHIFHPGSGVSDSAGTRARCVFLVVAAWNGSRNAVFCFIERCAFFGRVCTWGGESDVGRLEERFGSDVEMCVD